MRQLVVDQLSREERDNLDSYLKRSLSQGSMEGIFWLDLPRDLIAEAQMDHEQCGPFCFAVELEDEALRLELLVRSRSNMHCSCIAYATPAQRDFALQFFDTMLETEHIKA